MDFYFQRQHFYLIVYVNDFGRQYIFAYTRKIFTPLKIRNFWWRLKRHASRNPYFQRWATVTTASLEIAGARKHTHTLQPCLALASTARKRHPAKSKDLPYACNHHIAALTRQSLTQHSIWWLIQTLPRLRSSLPRQIIWSSTLCSWPPYSGSGPPEHLVWWQGSAAWGS